MKICSFFSTPFFVGDEEGLFVGDVEVRSFEGDVDFEGELRAEGAVPGRGPSNPGKPVFVGDVVLVPAAPAVVAVLEVVDDFGPALRGGGLWIFVLTCR